ncbi:hypothetical protein [Thiolapillus brandeum]|uniref:Uncharacterized protein n=1 Tax=Thiolapillus brandeum TaxID=1076588 RepID=A0A7U6JHZ3_9GAMM|nr:hypothetical protein [Thiolapillus brandeum]BAO44302.1 conserved hypothetical protein [Thiolapillus brandeum]
MPLYELEKLIAETRALAARYRETTGQTLPVTGEIARFDAARHLNLIPLEPREPGVDAVGSGAHADRRYQIKGRVIFNEGKSGYRIGQLNTSGDWTHVALVLLDANFEPYRIHEIHREAVLEALADSSGKRSRRGAMSVAKFEAISDLVWTRENGLEEQIWSND